MNTKSFNFNISILKISHFAYNLKDIITEYEDVIYENKCSKPLSEYTFRKQTVPNSLSSGNKT